MRIHSLFCLPSLLVLLAFVSCSSHRKSSVRVGKTPDGGKHAIEGIASWYGPGFHGRRTASGEVYDQYAMTAAHKTLPFGARVLVHNLDNGEDTWVRINDRGPFIEGRIIDLSRAGAEAISMVGPGIARVRLEIDPGQVDKSSRDSGQSTIRIDVSWAVQVGAFTHDENAWELVDELYRRGVEARVFKEGAIARVRVSGFRTEEPAVQLARTLRRDGFDAIVITER